MKKRSKGSLESNRNKIGYQFVAHWILGLLMFFVIPIIDSIKYSFTKIKITAGGLEFEFAAFKNYKEMLFDDAKYLDNIRDSISTIFTSVPIIIALSLILAIVLNQKFKGRLLARSIFFMPVIIATGVVMILLKSGNLRVPLFNVSSGAEYEYGGLIDFNEILLKFNFPSSINGLFSKYLSNIFDLIWSCGVQIILFLSGLQSISPQLYEVSKIEGATKWEEFWYVTIPMLKDVILLVIIYTMIELFTSLDNPVVAQAYSIMKNNQIYDLSSAMLWGYFAVVMIVMGIVLLLYKQFCLKKWE